MQKVTKLEQLDFFVEKLLQRHPLRNDKHYKFSRKKEEHTSQYILEEYLRKKKKISLNEMVDIMNPNAKVAKAKYSVKALKAKDKEGEFNSYALDINSAQDITKFLIELEMEAKQKRRKHINTASELPYQMHESEDEEENHDGFPNNETPIERHLKEKIARIFAMDPVFIEVYTKLARFNQINEFNESKTQRKTLKTTLKQSNLMEKKYRITHETLIKFFLMADLDPLTLLNINQEQVSVRSKEEVIVTHFDDDIISQFVGFAKVKKSPILSKIYEKRLEERKEALAKKTAMRKEKMRQREIESSYRVDKRYTGIMNDTKKRMDSQKELKIIRSMINKKKKDLFELIIPEPILNIKRDAEALFEEVKKLIASIPNKRIKNTYKASQRFMSPRKIKISNSFKASPSLKATSAFKKIKNTFKLQLDAARISKERLKLKNYNIPARPSHEIVIIPHKSISSKRNNPQHTTQVSFKTPDYSTIAKCKTNTNRVLRPKSVSHFKRELAEKSEPRNRRSQEDSPTMKRATLNNYSDREIRKPLALLSIKSTNNELQKVGDEEESRDVIVEDQGQKDSSVQPPEIIAQPSPAALNIRQKFLGFLSKGAKQGDFGETVKKLKAQCLGSRVILSVVNKDIHGIAIESQKEYNNISKMFDEKVSNPSFDQAKMFFQVRERRIFNERIAWMLVKMLYDKKKVAQLSEAQEIESENNNFCNDNES